MRGKNILWISIVAILLGTLAMVPAGKTVAPTTLYIDPTRIPDPGLTGNIGDEYILAVNVENARDLWAAGFRIRFAPFASVLKISMITQGTFLSEDGAYPTNMAYTIDLFYGTAYIAITRMGGWGDIYGVSGDGTLCTFKMTVMEAGSSAIGLEDTKLVGIPDTFALLEHKAQGSAYFGNDASLVRVEMLPGRSVNVGETINFNAKVRNNGLIPLRVKVRVNAVRAEDGRYIEIRSGQTYYDGGLGELPPSWETWLYANAFTGSYGEGWGWNYVGTAPYVNAVGDGSYIWTDAALMEEGEYPGYYPYTGKYDFEDFVADPDRVIDNVEFYAYTKYAWGLDEANDLDTYMRAPVTEAPPSTWIGSLWGTGEWGWHTVRWTTDTVSDLYPITKTVAGLNGVRVRFMMYWTADDLEHGRVDVDAMALKVTEIPLEWGITPVNAPYFVVMPGEELDLAPIIWKAKTSHIGSYSAIATIEYTSAGIKWNSWGSMQKTFNFKILP